MVIAAGGSDPTATATLVLAGITLALVLAGVALLALTRAAVSETRADARKALDLIRRQLGAVHRPLLVGVPVTARGPSSEARFPGLEPRPLDSPTVLVALEAGKIYVSVPLRNVGGGLAAIDGGSVTLTGPRAGGVEYRTVQQEHLPAGETTRIDLIAAHLLQQGSDPGEQASTMRGTAWQLAVSYSDFDGAQAAVARFQIVCRGDDIAGPWLVERVEHEGPGDQMTHPAELLDPSSPERIDPPPERVGVRGEPVVDLWGNPVGPRRPNR